MTKKRIYEAPKLTVVSFKAERGFALSILSGSGPFDEMIMFEETHDTRQVEVYDHTPYWDAEGNHFWQ